MTKNSVNGAQKQHKAKNRERFYHTSSDVSDDDLRDMIKWFAELQPKFGVVGIAKMSRRGEGSHGWWQRFAIMDVARLEKKRGHKITKYQIAKMERERFKTIRVGHADYDSLYMIWRVNMLQGRVPEELLMKMGDYMYHNGMAQAVFSDIVDTVWKMAGRPEGFDPIRNGMAVGI